MPYVAVAVVIGLLIAIHTDRAGGPIGPADYRV
jgi:hypothetical protein